MKKSKKINKAVWLARSTRNSGFVDEYIIISKKIDKCVQCMNEREKIIFLFPPKNYIFIKLLWLNINIFCPYHHKYKVKILTWD